jgi:hypothetical protein
MQKTLSLMELMVGISLLGIIILGVTAFDAASHRFLRSSERSVEVLNELTYILEHIAKNVEVATGDITDAGIVIDESGGTEDLNMTIRIDQNDPPTPGDYSDDTLVRYYYDASPPLHAEKILYFYPNYTGNPNDEREVLSYRVTNIIVSNSTSNDLIINNLTLRYNRDEDINNSTNPEVTIENITFISSSHSTN